MSKKMQNSQFDESIFDIIESIILKFVEKYFVKFVESIDYKIFLNSQSILVPVLSEIAPEYFNSRYFNVTDEVVFEEEEKVEEELDSS